MKKIVTAVLAAGLVGIASLAGMAGQATAQTKVGTTIGTFLRIEPSARAAGMGNAGVAMPADIESAYFNVGTIGLLEQAEVQYTHSLWYADISYDYAAVAVPVSEKGNLLLSVTSLSSGDIQVRTVEQPNGTGVFYSVTNVALGVAYGRRITERFSAGIQANYISESIWNTSTTALSVNLGTIYRLSDSGASLGFGLANLSTRTRFSGDGLGITYDSDPDIHGDNSALPAEQSTDRFPLPGLFRLGLSYPYVVSEDSRFLFLIEGLHPADNSESLNLGAEWTLMRMFSLRAGYQTLFQTDSQLGMTLGFGVAGNLGNQRYHLNYAWAGHKRLEDTHRMTMSIAF
ncbi:hypothetical protein CSB20_01225 [bacterium DOLZORAL124_64_63]|nr:MAG: hypothetical protein CSB20_01225 [bacterium DOLZORAL124_64_63]